MTNVDVVVLSYNSAETLRDCVAPLAGRPGITVTVVDNDSVDGSLASLEGLEVRRIPSGRNGGFAFGMNIGWRAGRAPHVLLLNPDGQIAADDVHRLSAALDREPNLGIVAPRLMNADGTQQWSLRRFPTLASTFSHALFLGHLFPSAPWTDEVVRTPEVYEHDADVPWVSGACLMIRRATLERLGGLDEGFFLYSEDKDLCRRTHALGQRVAYRPAARASHIGGHSAPRGGLIPVLTASRLRYARLHSTRPAALGHRIGITLGCLTHAVAGRQGGAMRAGHARGALVGLLGRRAVPAALRPATGAR